MQENEDVGFIVGEVFAEDIDSGTYGEIVYSISGPGSEKYDKLIFAESIYFCRNHLYLLISYL